MAVQELTKRKHKVAIMNAVHDLPVLVARDKGLFKDEGLDIEFVSTPGMAQVTTSHTVKFDTVFDRPLDSVYNDGGIDQYRMCEWGIMKRAVEADTSGLRRRKIVALGASMSKFAIVVDKGSKIYEPEMLKDKLISVTPNNGSHFTMLKMVEGFLEPEHVKTTNAGSMQKRIEALKRGEVAAVVLMEPWISVAQKEGLAHPDRVALDAQRGGVGRSGRPDAGRDVPRTGARGGADREGPDAVRALPGGGNRRAARGEGFPDVAAAARPAAALHARAVRRYLQLDGQVEHDRAGRDLREHGRQPRVDVS